jgi:predicted PurR-regulated permease PerM
MGVAILKFLLAIVLAGIVMAYGERGAKTAEAIASRLAGPERGVELARLATAIVRAVAQGVIGIAFIQALLLGLGFIVGGVPAPGILVVIVFLLGVMQLPATLVTLPVILYMFTTEMSSGAFLAFAVYTAAAGLADNVLKPLMLGRGVDVPMPVVLIGALGGMVTGGLLGLFIGPVTLALGYALFMAWVDEEAPLAAPAALPAEPTSLDR